MADFDDAAAAAVVVQDSFSFVDSAASSAWIHESIGIVAASFGVEVSACSAAVVQPGRHGLAAVAAVGAAVVVHSFVLAASVVLAVESEFAVVVACSCSEHFAAFADAEEAAADEVIRCSYFDCFVEFVAFSFAAAAACSYSMGLVVYNEAVMEVGSSSRPAAARPFVKKAYSSAEVRLVGASVAKVVGSCSSVHHLVASDEVETAVC